MNKLPLILSGLISFLVLISCSKKDNDIHPSNARVAGVPASDSNGHCLPLITDLFAGKYHHAGKVMVSNDSINLYITFNTSDGWQLGVTHVYAGPLSALPATSKSNPKIGNFPFKSIHNPYVTNFTYTIPLSTFGDENCIVVATHAEAHLIDANGVTIQKETAWGTGIQMADKGSWASYIPYCTCTDDGGNYNGGGN